MGILLQQKLIFGDILHEYDGQVKKINNYRNIMLDKITRVYNSVIQMPKRNHCSQAPTETQSVIVIIALW